MTERTVPVSSLVPFWINGAEHNPTKSFDVISPATGQVVHRSGGAGPDDVRLAVAAAAEAFKTWRVVTPPKRRDIFLRTAEVMERRRNELAGYMAAETGAAPGFVGFNLMTAVDILKDVAGRIATVEGMVPGTNDEGLGALVLKEPYGVILGIAPWYGRKLGPATSRRAEANAGKPGTHHTFSASEPSRTP
jgi:acyl-CoA reductase-like NAD-dependent aldehyde dehydrogenase